MPPDLEAKFDALIKSFDDFEAAIKEAQEATKELYKVALEPDKETPTIQMVRTLKSCFPALTEIVDCPVSECSWHDFPLMDIVMHLNDDHKSYSREQIADWTETLDLDTTIKDA